MDLRRRWAIATWLMFAVILVAAARAAIAEPGTGLATIGLVMASGWLAIALLIGWIIKRLAPEHRGTGATAKGRGRKGT